ncbi:hypothetical protein SLEP1_g47601 [Rubroshorea leprosula]|uniref:Protein kinase domain-containing protein n=1 Tax=Rubroshorea leprosula TaxID=152421 RepID=A0AAV5LR60_9ROSI|nr:hypothetical protein SLEP1_g47601 [Rubroshorea leprosula]
MDKVLELDSALAKVFASVLGFFVVTFLFAVVFLLCKSRKPPNNCHQNGSIVPARSAMNPPDLTSVSVHDVSSFDSSLHQISMPELAAATKNFSADLVIGDGSFGLVYKATLSNGVTVAIKKLDRDAFQGLREFRAEMETLGKLSHQNLVRILGYCSTGLDRILIYEFLEKGSVDQWLHDTSSREECGLADWRSPLSWKTKIKVVRGIANGLAYLHGLDTPIIHRDIKASNVLLDSDFEAHISDFGLARQVKEAHSHVSTQVAGTMGYMPPEYREGNTAATVMADVYSFGILMIEIATERRPNWPVTFDGVQVGLVEWARKMAEQNREMEMLGENVSNEGLMLDNVKEYFRIARLCTSEVTRGRPAMSQVVEMLDGIST